MVMICVAQSVRRKGKIKAIPCFTHLCGHYMDDQFVQVLCPVTERIDEMGGKEVALDEQRNKRTKWKRLTYKSMMPDPALT